MQRSGSSAKPDRALSANFRRPFRDASPSPSGQGFMEVQVVNTAMTGHIPSGAHFLRFGGANVRKVVNPGEAQKDTREPRK